MTLLEVKGLRKRFPMPKRQWLHAVEDVDLAIGAGESLGLVGESGSGKSTIARLLAGLLEPDQGRIELAAGAEAGKRPMQMVFQTAEDVLNPAHSIARNISIGLGRTRLAERSRIDEAARLVGLDRELLDRRPHQLSGGQQARASIARALIAQPQLLLLDEPTAALDVSVQASVLRLIDRLRREQNIAILFISHDLEVIRLMCDRVMVLYLGRVAETGPVQRIVETPRHPYSRALLAASPGRSAAPPVIEGETASPIDPPMNACLFRNRCPQASDVCGRTRPPLVELAPGWQVACHHPLADEVNAPVVCSPR